VFKVLELQPSLEQTSMAVKLIEQAIIEGHRESAKHCSTVASQSLGADSDLAHKISDEMRRENLLLIANLSSLQ
tara:strand:- start:10722 stop:10943 length:222 start_codon:yes stop_codon:yes gene_type:complete